jgi:hypothetical protein
MAEEHPVRVIEISKRELQDLFNEEGYWERAQRGELLQTLEEDGHPSPPLAKEEVCTRSQIIAYRQEDGSQVARVHQYLRRDGTIGASGRPDPQEVLFEDALYIVDLYG